MANNCSICGKSLNFFSEFMIIKNADMVCYDCLRLAGYSMDKVGALDYIKFRKVSKDEILRKTEEKRLADETRYKELIEKKYCDKCHNVLNDSDEFCPYCGKPISINAIIDRYVGITYSGIYKNKLEITPNGLLIYSDGTFLMGGYEKLIPYSDIRSINYKPALIEDGYISIVTGEAGVTGNLSLRKMKDCGILSSDPNTLCFRKKATSQFEELYLILEEIRCKGSAFARSWGDTNCLVVDFDQMDGHEFEYYCADILRKNGFKDVSVTPGSGDQGVDVLATKDGIKYAIQCKNYASPLGNTPVQEVNAGKVYYNCHVGVVMTNSVFTPGAVQLAEATGVLLWDGSKLEDMIRQIKE